MLVDFLAADFFADAFLATLDTAEPADEAADFLADTVVAELVAVLAAFLAVDFLAAVFAEAAFLADVRAVLPLETFLVVISSVYLRAIAARCRIVETALFSESADFGKSDATIDVRQRPLDQLLKIVKVHRAGSPQHD